MVSFVAPINTAEFVAPMNTAEFVAPINTAEFVSPINIMYHAYLSHLQCTAGEIKMTPELKMRTMI